MTAEEDEAQRKLFNAEDADMDDQLTDAETILFLKKVIGENEIDDECLQLWHGAMASLNAETDSNISYDDYERSKKIMLAWSTSAKAIQKMLSQLPAEERAAVERMLAGDMTGMLEGGVDRGAEKGAAV